MSEENPLPTVVTLGVYGCGEAEFFAMLARASVDTFCDIRYRRGVRGADYAFVNSRRLQRRLAEMGIRYFHFRELAPSPTLRKRQAELDKAQGTAKRQRQALGEVFVSGYGSECLAHFNSRQFLAQLGKDVRVLALFCVEREPAACHRSLLAERLRQELGVRVIHLFPEGNSG